jgi:hypothetical protein
VYIGQTGETMKRTNIYLTDNEHKAVAKEAKKLSLSKAEVIRRSIDEQLLQRDFRMKIFRKAGLVK